MGKSDLIEDETSFAYRLSQSNLYTYLYETGKA